MVDAETSALYQPQLNRQAERIVDMFKRTMNKLFGKENVEDSLTTFLYSYRTTLSPNPNRNSPFELMLGWQPINV